jgi:ABC-type dipeptide/oligopeptide/nickel transport system permease component
VWTYIIRRLFVMLPTLFGVTIVSFVIMQLAPGDPLRNQLSPSGMAGQSGQNREAYLIQKRDLKLDKPLVLNFNYFRDFRDEMQVIAHYLGAEESQVAAELPELAAHPEEPTNAARLQFLRRLGIDAFDERLADPQRHPELAKAIQGYLGMYSDDLGIHGVEPAIAILRSDKASQRDRIGAIRALNHMVVDPLVYTYSREPSEKNTAEIVDLWRRWWQRAQEADQKRLAEGLPPQYPPLSAERRKALAADFAAALDAPTRAEMFDRLQFFDSGKFEPFQEADMRFFVEKLLEAKDLEERVVAVTTLSNYVGEPVEMDVPLDAPAEQVAWVAENWQLHYQYHGDQYEVNPLAKAWYIIADTQYAHMLWRLASFDFGRSATRTREPVADKILDAVIVSAPLMLMAQLVIYLVAVPLGIICAVHRGRWPDRLISLGLFLLYSIPAFVAAMLFLLFFAYGDYLTLFPMEGLHSDWAEDYGLLRYLADYAWHAFLPVVCLSLFSLAGLAMYSRTSMLDVIGQDYIRTARAKGLPESRVIYKHGLRNAMIPIITLFANFLPAMLGGSVLVEYIFNIPGMGRLSWESIEQQDFPTLMALIYIDAIVVMLSILLTDLLYVFVDPRISFEAQGKSA